MTRDALKTQTVFELAGDWKTDLANLIKKEVELAKTEMSETVSSVSRNLAYIAAGGVLALMSLLILLFSIGAVIAFGLRAAGLSVGMSYFLGYLILALVSTGAGLALIMKGKKAFARTSLAPEKALDTIRDLKGEPALIQKPIPAQPKEPKVSSKQLKQEVDATVDRLEVELQEMKSRLRPGHVCRTAWAMTREHPFRVFSIALATGLSSALLIRNKLHARA